MSEEGKGYLLAGQISELERLQLQSRVWESTGRQLLSQLDGGTGGWVLDVGCGVMSWLRILSEWVGPSGRVVGTDIDEHLLDAARSFLEAEGIPNVDLVVDDVFDSKLEPRSFDLVHARFLIAPLGRGREQVAAHRRLVKPGGWLVLEEWDTSSWHFNPPAPAAERLIQLLYEIFRHPRRGCWPRAPGAFSRDRHRRPRDRCTRDRAEARPPLSALAASVQRVA